MLLALIWLLLLLLLIPSVIRGGGGDHSGFLPALVPPGLEFLFGFADAQTGGHYLLLLFLNQWTTSRIRIIVTSHTQDIVAAAVPKRGFAIIGTRREMGMGMGGNGGSTISSIEPCLASFFFFFGSGSYCIVAVLFYLLPVSCKLQFAAKRVLTVNKRTLQVDRTVPPLMSRRLMPLSSLSPSSSLWFLVGWWWWWWR